MLSIFTIARGSVGFVEPWLPRHSGNADERDFVCSRLWNYDFWEFKHVCVEKEIKCGVETILTVFLCHSVGGVALRRMIREDRAILTASTGTLFGDCARKGKHTTIFDACVDIGAHFFLEHRKVVKMSNRRYV